ncbi:MAG: hypothetical protein QM820_25550 [Minicystis sp.]
MQKTFKTHAKVFIAIQTQFEAAAVAAEKAERARDDALAVVGQADEALDGSIDTYADDLSAAKLGPRQNPFKPFSKHPPSAMKALPYATEPKAVRALVAEVSKKKPPANVVKSGAACLARCTAVEKALKDLGKPASAYQKALAARDALLPGLQKAIKTLKTHAASAYADDEATVKALFAPPDAVQAPKVRRLKTTKQAKPAPAPAKPAPTKPAGNGATTVKPS